MKPALILLLLSWSLCAIAQADPDTPVDFVLEGEDLSEAIIKLSQQTGVNIAFSNSSLPEIPSLIYEAQGKSVIQILQELLDGQGFRVERIKNSLALVPYDDIYSTYVVSGYVRNVNTGERLVAAHIVDLESQRGTFTNEFGFFSLRLERGEKEVNIGYIGYSDFDLSLDLEQDAFVEVDLIPSLELSEVIITGREYWKIWEQSTNARNIPLQGLNARPTLGGRADPIRYTHNLAGVSTNADGVGGVSVRGANQEHNLFLLDGVKVYNPGHMNGLLSIFDDQIISSARFYKTPGPARYQGALSSVFDIRTEEGNRKEFEFGLNADLISTSFDLQGPIIKERSSFLINGRYSYVGPLINQQYQDVLQNNDESGELDYDFYDVFVKANYQLGNRSDIYLSYYQGRDQFENTKSYDIDMFGPSLSITEDQELEWGNRLASLRWNNRFSSRAFAKLSLLFSEYEQSHSELVTQLTINPLSEDQRETSFVSGQSRIQDYGAQLDFDFIPSPAHTIRIGAQWMHHEFAPGLEVVTADGEELLIEDNPSMLEENEAFIFSEISAYIEDDINIKDKLKINLGLNTSLFPLGERREWQVNPRFNLDLTLSDKLHWYANVSRASQYFHLLQTANFGLPSDNWVPLTDQIAPQTAWAYGTSIGVYLGQHQLNAGVFYKELTDLLELKEGSLSGLQAIRDIGRWQELVTRGDGRSRGIEFEWTKYGRKFDWLLSYTYSESRRQFDELNNGKEYADFQDRPHNASAEFQYRWSKSWQTSFSVNYASGSPVNFPEASRVIRDPESGRGAPIVPLLTERNAVRLPDYFRADASVQWKKRGEQLTHSLTLGVYNLTDRENPLYYRFFDRAETTVRYTQNSLLGISPTLNYSLRF